jgi:cyclohexanone monooxygenase
MPRHDRAYSKAERLAYQDEQGQQAYKGAAVAGFPNLLFVVGPNTGLGHSSMGYMIESHLNYLSSTLKTMDSRGLAPSRCAPTSSAGTTLWPGFTFAFRQMTRTFVVSAYDTTPVGDRAKERVSA